MEEKAEVLDDSLKFRKQSLATGLFRKPVASFLKKIDQDFNRSSGVLYHEGIRDLFCVSI
jgi:hypothetical protein